MARTPKLTSDIPSHVEKDEAVQRERGADRADRAVFKGKVFSELTSDEKDDLLKRLAIRAGIMEE